MRHRNKVNNLSRTSSHRNAMLSNMAASLILHKRITTTVAKAKALRTYVEPIINRSKEDSTHSRRMVFRLLQSKIAVTELFREISIRIADRPGGYTRIIKLGNRLGDSAEMCLIELVDFNEILLTEKGTKKAAKTTRRRSTKKVGVKADAPNTTAVSAEAEKSEEIAVNSEAALETVAELPEVQNDAIDGDNQQEESEKDENK
jgi:large subunit ribosomal protein L17